MTTERDLIRRLADVMVVLVEEYPGYSGLLHEARAYLATPEPTPGPTDEEIDDETATLIPWLLEKALQAANSDAPHAAGQLTLAAQLLGERYRPEPEPAPGATLNDIFQLCAEHEFVLGIDGANEEESANGLLAIVRAVLARFGHRPEPIALSDRLPGPEGCDAEGRCWVFDQGDAVTAPAWNYESSADLQDLRRMQDEGQLIGLCERWRLAWLPHHALPLPGGEV